MHILALLLLLLLAACVPPPSAPHGDLCMKLANLPHANTACVVKDQITWQPVSEYRSDRLMVPASMLKLLTYLVGLKELGPDYRFTTTLYALPGGEAGLRLVGDPMLASKDLVTLLRALPISPATLRIDDTALALSPYAPGMAIEDVQFCFAAPLTAAMLGRNCTQLQLAPTQDSKPVRIEFADAWASSFIRNEVITDIECATDGSMLKQAQNEHITVLSGCLPEGGEPMPLNLPLRHPQKVIIQALYAAASEAGVRLGKVYFAPLPTEPLPALATHISPTFQELSITMLKESDNIIANRLFSAMVAQHDAGITEWQDAGKALLALSEKHYSLPPMGASLYDGAGLSYYNRISANYFADLLRKARNDPSIYPLLVEALPRNGVDGTLAKRLPHLSGKIYAKTGGLKGISNLAGFTTLAGKEEIFVLMINFWPVDGQGSAFVQIDNILEAYGDRGSSADPRYVRH
jgi:D-alanyl-D-alanine carboxypeptidase/D-alanyl-D-alanine-endopeptidase (penicillin-binding protein 4)